MVKDRLFSVGETVHLGVKVSVPGGKKPTDAGSVVVSAFKRDGTPVTLTTTAFTRVAEGDYALVVPTAGFTPGTYTFNVTVASGPTKVSIVSDRFVLQAAA